MVLPFQGLAFKLQEAYGSPIPVSIVTTITVLKYYAVVFAEIYRITQPNQKIANHQKRL